MAGLPGVGYGGSYHYARRQWNLVDDQSLLYRLVGEMIYSKYIYNYCRYLNQFDAAMKHLEAEQGWLASDPGFVSPITRRTR